MKVEVEFEETSIIYYKIEIEVDEEPIEEGCRNCPNGLEKETCTCIDRYDEDIREKIKDKIV